MNLKPGMKRLTILRIDEEKRWDEKELELIPVEQRRIVAMSELEYQCYCPEYGVVMMKLEELEG